MALPVDKMEANNTELIAVLMRSHERSREFSLQVIGVNLKLVLYVECLCS